MDIEIVDLPSYKMFIFHSYVSLPEGKQGQFCAFSPCPEDRCRQCDWPALCGSDEPLEMARASGNLLRETLRCCCKVVPPQRYKLGLQPLFTY